MIRRQAGFLLVTTLLIALVVVVLVFGLVATSLIDRQSSAAQRDANRAYYLAQLGLDRIETGVFINFAVEGNLSETGVCGSPAGITFDFGDGLTLQEDTWSEYVPLDEGGVASYRVQYVFTGDLIVLRSEGVVGNAAAPRARSRLQAVATLKLGGAGGDLGALTAQSIYGQTGKTTQVGRVAAFGSVNVVNGSLLVDEGDDVLGLSGDSGIFNNYLGDSNANGIGGNSVVAEATTALGASRAGTQDLCTRVKIDRGNLIINPNSNNANIGFSVGTFEDQMDNPRAIWGMYFGEGNLISGYDGTDENGTPIPVPIEPTPANSMYVRNPISYYDEPDSRFPTLHVDFPDELNGDSFTINESTECPLLAEVTVGSGPNATTETRLQVPPKSWPGSLDVLTCGSLGSHGVSYDRSTNTLTVEGNVNVKGIDVEIRSPSSNTPFVYTDGWGSLRVEQSISVTAGMVPRVAEDNFKVDENFGPVGSALALVAKGPMQLLANSNSSTISALVYSADTITLDGQAVIVGSVVGKEVFADGIPRIVYHPDIALAAAGLDFPGTGVDVEAGGEFSRFSVERY